MAIANSCVLRAAANGTSNATEEIVQANSATRIAWLVLNIWPSHFGLPLLVGTILLAKNIRRHATFINLCVTWIIVGVSSSLLLYGGFQTGPEPPKTLCLVQASLLYGQPGLTSISAFALVFQVFYAIRAAFHEKDPEHHERLRKWTLVLVPYIAFLTFASWTAFVGYKHPALVTRERRFFYCSVKDPTLTNSITGFSLCVLAVTIGLGLWILYTVLSHWRVMRAHELGASTGTDLNLICRTAAFGLWVFLGASLSALSIKAPRSPIPDMALATMGSAVVLIFGTQRDVLRAWLLCRRKQDGQQETRRASAPSFDQTNSPTSAHSRKSTDLSTLSGKSDSPIEIEHRQFYRPLSNERYANETLTTRDISLPVLRDDLTFTVFGQAI